MPSEPNFYQPPNADGSTSSTAQAKVYTAQQVGLATFLGGPIAGCLLLASNYATLGRQSARIQAIGWGVVGTALAFAVELTGETS